MLKEIFSTIAINNNSKLNNLIGIYGIYHKNSKMTYIGQSFDIKERVLAHLYNLQSNKHYNEILQREFNNGENLDFEIHILKTVIFNLSLLDEKVLISELDKLESRWINRYLKEKKDLFNSIKKKGRTRKYHNSKERYNVYTKTKPVIRVTPEEKDLIKWLRNNPNAYQYWIDQMNGTETIIINSDNTKLPPN